MRTSDLFLLKSLPISYVTEPIVRSFSKFDEKLSDKSLKAVIFKITVLVKKRIVRLMEGTDGAIGHLRNV